MHSDIRKPKLVLDTPWFKVAATQDGNQTSPHYVIHSPDFAVIVALDQQGQLLRVRQFRPAVNGMTLELPAGHIEPGEKPEAAARKELLEETGHEADSFELLAVMSPSAARFTNRMWCFFASDARLAPDYELQREAGLEWISYPGRLTQLLAEKEFFSAISHAALCAAVLRGKIKP